MDFTTRSRCQVKALDWMRARWSRTDWRDGYDWEETLTGSLGDSEAPWVWVWAPEMA